MTDTFQIVADNKTTHYASAKEAGVAFFEADSAQRPSVILSRSASSDASPKIPARSIATTEIDGRYENGNTRFVKVLPRTDSEADKDFHIGYFEALNKSVNDRLRAVDWEAAKLTSTSAAPKLDPLLYDDLEQLSKNNFEKAAKAWEDHALEGITIPMFVDREWKRQNDEVQKAVELIQMERLEPDAANEKNIVEMVKETEFEIIDNKEANIHAKSLRQHEREQLAHEQIALGIKAEGSRIDVENLSEKELEQDEANDITERAGGITDRDSQQYTESEKNRQVELMEQVHSQFRVMGSKFYFKDQPSMLAIKDKGKRMVSASNDDRVAKAMATMAEAKGWKTIKVSGHPQFQREVWMAASLRGIEVRGYKPSEQDLKLFEDKRERAMRNIVEHGQTARERKPEQQGQGVSRKTDSARQNRFITADKTEGSNMVRPAVETAEKAASRVYTGQILEHGAANFNHDPKEKLNYFVKLATDKGEKTIWGVDLKRAVSKGKVKVNDNVKLEYRGNTPVTVEALKRDKAGKVIGKEEITTNRNHWHVQKSDKAKVVEAVASAFIDAKVKNPKQREALKTAVGARMTERGQANKVPTVPVYDKAAPAKSKQPERTGPVVERNAERTR